MYLSVLLQIVTLPLMVLFHHLELHLLVILPSGLTTFTLILMNVVNSHKFNTNTSLNNFNTLVLKVTLTPLLNLNFPSTILARNLSGYYN